MVTTNANPATMFTVAHSKLTMSAGHVTRRGGTLRPLSPDAGDETTVKEVFAAALLTERRRDDGWRG